MNRIAVFGIAIMAFGIACGRGEIKGTYEVEIEIAGAPRSLEGVLILSTQPLELPSLNDADAPVWSGDDVHAANSCLILSQGQFSQADPGIVRVFETRIQSNAVRVPVEILNAGGLRIEVTDWQFFGNTTGGELQVVTERGSVPGRIFGNRIGTASSMRCVEALDEFRVYLQSIQTEPAPQETRDESQDDHRKFDR